MGREVSKENGARVIRRETRVGSEGKRNRNEEKRKKGGKEEGGRRI